MKYTDCSLLVTNKPLIKCNINVIWIQYNIYWQVNTLVCPGAQYGPNINVNSKSWLSHWTPVAALPNHTFNLFPHYPQSPFALFTLHFYHSVFIIQYNPTLPTITFCIIYFTFLSSTYLLLYHQIYTLLYYSIFALFDFYIIQFIPLLAPQSGALIITAKQCS